MSRCILQCSLFNVSELVIWYTNVGLVLRTNKGTEMCGSLHMSPAGPENTLLFGLSHLVWAGALP